MEKKTRYQKKKDRMKRDPEFALREKSAKAATMANRRAKDLGVKGRITTIEVERIFSYFAKECPYCKRGYTKKNPQSLDHVIPLTKEFGYNDPSNLIAVCLNCNLRKKDKNPGGFWLDEGFSTEDFIRIMDFLLNQNIRSFEEKYTG